MVNECQKQLMKRGYRIENLISSGHFGIVYSVCHIDTGCNYIAKIQHNIKGGKDDKEHYFEKASERELNIIKRINGFNITPKYYDSWDCPYIKPKTIKSLENLRMAPKGQKFNNTSYIILEKWDGNISKFAKKLTDDEIMAVVKLISKLHKLNILHQDIKPENILYRDGSVGREFALTDFGISQDLKIEPIKRKQVRLWHKTWDYMRFLEELANVGHNTNHLLTLLKQIFRTEEFKGWKRDLSKLKFEKHYTIEFN
jgi:serine/threonine protein kinase